MLSFVLVNVGPESYHMPHILLVPSYIIDLHHLG